MPNPSVRLLGLAGIALLLLLAGPAPAWAAEALDECDRLASDPLDATGAGPGVADERIEVAAVAACEAAIARRDGEPRFRYQAARALFAAGRNEEAARRLGEAAGAGHARAQALLGLLYERGGFGLAADTAKSVALLQAAAGQGEPYAAFRLAERYEAGDGVPRSEREALIHYSMAAKSGIAKARAATERLAAKPVRAGAPFEVARVRYPPQVVAGGAPGALSVGYIGLPSYPVRLILEARACPAARACPPIVYEIAAPAESGELVVERAIDCAGVDAVWRPDFQLRLEDAAGQQTSPRSLGTMCYPDQASADADRAKRR